MRVSTWFKQNATEEPWHVTRFCRSWKWIRPYVGSGQRVLECGGEGPFTGWLRQNGIAVDSTAHHDLREPLPFPAGCYDVVLLMEVIEHVKDRDSSERSTFHGSGCRLLLQELNRVLRPGGVLFLTTPNLGCYSTILRVLNGQHPFAYPPHPREFVPADVFNLLDETGWRVVRAKSLDVWGGHYVSLRDRLAILRLRKQVGASGTWLSGDCLFILAQRDAPIDSSQ